jgi:hypothetical protein
MSVYHSTSGNRPDRHLKGRELTWFAFDPTPYVEFIRRADFGRDESLAERMATVRRAAWRCPSILVFASATIVPPSVPVYTEDEELVFDVDDLGNPVQVEFTMEECGV